MSVVSRTLVLTGARAGISCMCGKYPFKDGKLRLQGALNQVDGITKYLGRTYKAFPEGTDELLRHQRIDAERVAREEARNGVIPVHADSRGQISGGDGPDGKGSATVPTLVIGTSDNSDQGGAERVPDGDGLSDAGDAQRLASAMTSLDHQNDDHWTVDGRPAVQAVATLSGMANITRAMIDSVAPDLRRVRK